MARNEAQKAARAEYTKKCKLLRVMLYPTEQELIDKLESVENKSGYIKGLIRADIEKGRK